MNINAYIHTYDIMTSLYTSNDNTNSGPFTSWYIFYPSPAAEEVTFEGLILLTAGLLWLGTPERQSEENKSKEACQAYYM